MKITLHISFYQRFRVCNIIINKKKTNGAQ
jgi:hypothetical protein